MSDILIKLQNNIEKSNVNELQNIFYENAKKLMNEYVLVIEDKEFELTELEYYFYDENKHPDCYVHLNEMQKKTCGKLYVHNKGNWIGGIDITFGNGKYYGGILIRGIKYKNEFISGPAKTRQFFIKTFKLNEKINYKLLQKFFNDKKILLREKKEPKNNFDCYVDIRFNNGVIHYEQFQKLLYRFIRIDYFSNPTVYRKIQYKEQIRAISYLIYEKYLDNFDKVNKKIETIKQDQKLHKNIINFKKHLT